MERTKRTIRKDIHGESSRSKLSSVTSNVSNSKIENANTLIVCTNDTEIKTIPRYKGFMKTFKKTHTDFNEERILTIDALEDNDEDNDKEVDINGNYPEDLDKILHDKGIKDKKFKYILLWFCPFMHFENLDLYNSLDKHLEDYGYISVITGVNARDSFINAIEGDNIVGTEKTEGLRNEMLFQKSLGLGSGRSVEENIDRLEKIIQKLTESLEEAQLELQMQRGGTVPASHKKPPLPPKWKKSPTVIKGTALNTIIDIYSGKKTKTKRNTKRKTKRKTRRRRSGRRKSTRQ